MKVFGLKCFMKYFENFTMQAIYSSPQQSIVNVKCRPKYMM